MFKRMALLLAAVSFLGFLVAGCTSSGTANQSAAEFAATVATPNVVTLDVRTPEEFAAGHIRGAVNIDVEGPNFDAAIATLDPATTYAIYCRSGRRSAIAAEKMKAAGFNTICTLDGGIQTWTGELVGGTT